MRACCRTKKNTKFSDPSVKSVCSRSALVFLTHLNKQITVTFHLLKINYLVSVKTFIRIVSNSFLGKRFQDVVFG